jgi:hypothetical protein
LEGDNFTDYFAALQAGLNPTQTKIKSIIGMHNVTHIFHCHAIPTINLPDILDVDASSKTTAWRDAFTAYFYFHSAASKLRDMVVEEFNVAKTRTVIIVNGLHTTKEVLFSSEVDDSISDIDNMCALAQQPEFDILQFAVPFVSVILHACIRRRFINEHTAHKALALLLASCSFVSSVSLVGHFVYLFFEANQRKVGQLPLTAWILSSLVGFLGLMSGLAPYVIQEGYMLPVLGLVVGGVGGVMKKDHIEGEEDDVGVVMKKDHIEEEEDDGVNINLAASVGGTANAKVLALMDRAFTFNKHDAIDELPKVQHHGLLAFATHPLLAFATHPRRVLFQNLGWTMRGIQRRNVETPMLALEDNAQHETLQENVATIENLQGAGHVAIELVASLCDAKPYMDYMNCEDGATPIDGQDVYVVQDAMPKTTKEKYYLAEFVKLKRGKYIGRYTLAKPSKVCSVVSVEHAIPVVLKACPPKQGTTDMWQAELPELRDSNLARAFRKTSHKS